MLNTDTANLLHRDVEAVCEQVLKGYKELIDFSRALTELDPALADFIEGKISRADPGLGDFLAQNRYHFDMLLLIADEGITEILKRVDKKALTVSLKGCPEEIQNQFFRNMSSKAVLLMKEEMEFMGPVRLDDVKKVQKEIIELIKQLSQARVIEIGAAGGNDYVT